MIALAVRLWGTQNSTEICKRRQTKLFVHSLHRLASQLFRLKSFVFWVYIHLIFPSGLLSVSSSLRSSPIPFSLRNSLLSRSCYFFSNGHNIQFFPCKFSTSLFPRCFSLPSSTYSSLALCVPFTSSSFN